MNVNANNSNLRKGQSLYAGNFLTRWPAGGGEWLEFGLDSTYTNQYTCKSNKI